MAFSRGPSIIRNGLVFAIDAGTTRSYPGTGTSWYDISGNGNHATLNNGPTFSLTNSGAIILDGTNDSVTVADNSKLKFDSGYFTVEAVINITSISSKQRIVSRGSSSWSQGWHIAARSTQWEFECSDGVSSPGNSFLINTTTTVGINCVSWTVTPSSAILYINGSQLGSTQTITEGVAFANSTTTMGIGAFESGGEYLTGRIHTVRLYSRTLSASEILQNYNNTKNRYGL